jgi:4-hydroxy-tetrahydrodipicolinate synthase
MTVLERGGKFAQCVKYGCEMLGLPAGTVRLPLRPMKKELKRQMRDAVITARRTVQGILAETPKPVAAAN